WPLSCTSSFNVYRSSRRPLSTRQEPRIRLPLYLRRQPETTSPPFAPLVPGDRTVAGVLPMQSTPLAPVSPPGPFLFHRVRVLALPVQQASDPRLVSELHHESELGRIPHVGMLFDSLITE